MPPPIDLFCEVVDAKNKFPSTISEHHIDRGRLVSYLQKSPLFDFDRKEWRYIPKSPEQGADLHKPIFEIFRAISFEFNCAKLTPTSRPRGLVRTRCTETTDIKCSDNTVYTLRARPARIITGIGPNFPPEQPQTNDRNLFCVAPLELKLEGDLDDVKLQMQMCVYARQCFTQQMNRKFAFVLVISEMSARLYQFDRTGLQRFPRFNYHKNPLDFLRLVIGLLAADDDACGFDTSIFWKGACRYMRSIDENNELVEYKLEKVVLNPGDIGMGSFWWTAKDPHETLFMIEETWRFVDQQSGDELLHLLRGVNGVGQVLAYEEVFNTSQFRDPGSVDTVRPQVRSRIIFKGYENTIDKFKSRLEFLYSFRDAVAGHQNLWNKGVLHRNVSINNVRLGHKYAGLGNSGVLTGIFHGAVNWESSRELELADHSTGVPRFQSIMVLSSCPTFEDYSPFNYDYESAPHDYLDDLESFFYIFVWICIGYSGPGRPHMPTMQLFSIWDEGGIFSAHAKRWLLSERTDEKWEVSAYFGPIFQALFRQLRIFVGERLNAKRKALRLFDWPRKPSDFKYVTDDYARFLGFIDKALKSLNEETFGESPAAVVPRKAVLLPYFFTTPAPLLGPLAYNTSDKRPHPIHKPVDENDGTVMPEETRSLKDFQGPPTAERRVSRRNPPYQPLGSLL